MVKYRIIMVYSGFKQVKEVLDHYKLKWEVFIFRGVYYFVFRCGDKRYNDILKLVTTRTDAIGMDGRIPKAPDKKHHQVKKNRAFHYA